MSMTKREFERQQQDQWQEDQLYYETMKDRETKKAAEQGDLKREITQKEKGKSND